MTVKSNHSIICVVDDDSDFREILCDLLRCPEWEVIDFPSATSFLNSQQFKNKKLDLIITDINMPGETGFELCQIVRSHYSQDRIPIIMLTGDDIENEKAIGIQVGADEFLQKPFKREDLLAKVRSLLGIRYRSLNLIDRLTKLISPKIADLIVNDDSSNILKLHRAHVTVLFIDIRGFTAFSESTEPEDVLDVLNNYYRVVGKCADSYRATLGHLAGDGIMLFLNDPEPIENHLEMGLRLALDIRNSLLQQKEHWKQRNYNIDFGIGLAEGFATIGGVGFDRFWHYSVIGPVANFASRMCHCAKESQILVSHRFFERLTNKDLFEYSLVGTVNLKGIDKNVRALSVLNLQDQKISKLAG